MAKKIEGYIKLQIAGGAGQSIAAGRARRWVQRGLNIMEFCKAFNAATQNLEPGTPIPVVITASTRTAPSRSRPRRAPASYFS